MGRANLAAQGTGRSGIGRMVSTPSKPEATLSTGFPPPARPETAPTPHVSAFPLVDEGLRL